MRAWMIFATIFMSVVRCGRAALGIVTEDNLVGSKDRGCVSCVTGFQYSLDALSFSESPDGDYVLSQSTTDPPVVTLSSEGVSESEWAISDT